MIAKILEKPTIAELRDRATKGRIALALEPGNDALIAGRVVAQPV